MMSSAAVKPAGLPMLTSRTSVVAGNCTRRIDHQALQRCGRHQPEREVDASPFLLGTDGDKRGGRHVSGPRVEHQGIRHGCCSLPAQAECRGRSFASVPVSPP